MRKVMEFEVWQVSKATKEQRTANQTRYKDRLFQAHMQASGSLPCFDLPMHVIMVFEEQPLVGDKFTLTFEKKVDDE